MNVLFAKLSKNLFLLLVGMIIGALLGGWGISSCSRKKQEQDAAKFRRLKLEYRGSLDKLKEKHKKDLQQVNNTWSRRLVRAKAEIPRSDSVFVSLTQFRHIEPVTTPEKPMETHVAMQPDTVRRRRAERSNILVAFEKKKSYGAIEYITPKGLSVTEYLDPALLDGNWRIDSTGFQADKKSLRKVKWRNTVRDIKAGLIGAGSAVTAITIYIIASKQ
jgi:hypothetical protein